MDYKAKIFLDKKQDEHFKEYGVYADVNNKIAEWIQEYADIEIREINKQISQIFKNKFNG